LGKTLDFDPHFGRMRALVRETSDNNNKEKTMSKKKKKMKKFGNPQKQSAYEKMTNKVLRSRLKKLFAKSCDVPVIMPMITKRDDKCWTFSPQCNNNVSLDFVLKLDPNFMSFIKGGEMTTAAQQKRASARFSAGDKFSGDALTWNFFEVRVNGEKSIRGKWWGMKGEEFSKIYKNIPTTWTPDGVIVCDICPV
jgi:hypothetical protein